MLLIVVGVYLVDLTGIFNIAMHYSSSTGSGPITFVEDLSARLSPNI